jgi:hypothetical protein
MFQVALMFRPDAGDVIPGGGGLRKARWRLRGAGKRGGLRVIYYFDRPDTIYLLFAYSKRRAIDLTTDQLRALSRLIKEELK